MSVKFPRWLRPKVSNKRKAIKFFFTLRVATVYLGRVELKLLNSFFSFFFLFFPFDTVTSILISFQFLRAIYSKRVIRNSSNRLNILIINSPRLRLFENQRLADT